MRIVERIRQINGKCFRIIFTCVGGSRFWIASVICLRRPWTVKNNIKSSIAAIFAPCQSFGHNELRPFNAKDIRTTCGVYSPAIGEVGVVLKSRHRGINIPKIDDICGPLGCIGCCLSGQCPDERVQMSEEQLFFRVCLTGSIDIEATPSHHFRGKHFVKLCRIDSLYAFENFAPGISCNCN